MGSRACCGMGSSIVVNVKSSIVWEELAVVCVYLRIQNIKFSTFCENIKKYVWPCSLYIRIMWDIVLVVYRLEHYGKKCLFNLW